MLRLAVVFAVFAVTLAYLERSKLPPKPDKYADVEGCYIAPLDRMVSFGDKAVDKGAGTRCAEYRCYEDEIVKAGCGSVGIKEECTEVADEDQYYPGCCPQEQCPDDN